MKHVALLRAINVGGNNKIEMARLKEVVQGLGYGDVRTYINSGNLILDAGDEATSAATARIEEAIAAEWGLPIKVLLRSAEQIAKLVQLVPDDWQNDNDHKCDVLFLWDEALRRNVRDELPTKEGIDELIFAPNDFIWRVSRANVTRSGLTKLVGTRLYAQMTVRNVNTVRKLAALMG
jgi:uncharacterized protein (DUF1697 family)